MKEHQTTHTVRAKRVAWLSPGLAWFTVILPLGFVALIGFFYALFGVIWFADRFVIPIVKWIIWAIGGL